VRRDVKRQAELLAVESEEHPRENQVRGARNREEFRYTLDDAQQCGLDERRH